MSLCVSFEGEDDRKDGAPEAWLSSGACVQLFINSNCLFGANRSQAFPHCSRGGMHSRIMNCDTQCVALCIYSCNTSTSHVWCRASK